MTKVIEGDSGYYIVICMAFVLAQARGFDDVKNSIALNCWRWSGQKERLTRLQMML